MGPAWAQPGPCPGSLGDGCVRQMMPEFSGPGTSQWASRALFPAREAWGRGSGGDGGLCRKRWAGSCALPPPSRCASEFTVLCHRCEHRPSLLPEADTWATAHPRHVTPPPTADQGPRAGRPGSIQGHVASGQQSWANPATSSSEPRRPQALGRTPTGWVRVGRRPDGQVDGWVTKRACAELGDTE